MLNYQAMQRGVAKSGERELDEATVGHGIRIGLCHIVQESKIAAHPDLIRAMTSSRTWRRLLSWSRSAKLLQSQVYKNRDFK